MGSAPLRAWSDTSPQEWLTLVKDNDLANGFLKGWAIAAQREADAAWIDAIAPALFDTVELGRPGAWTDFVLGVMTACPAVGERVLASHLKQGGKAYWRATMVLLDAAKWSWSEPFTTAAMAWLGDHLREAIADRSASLQSWGLLAAPACEPQLRQIIAALAAGSREASQLEDLRGDLTALADVLLARRAVAEEAQAAKSLRQG